MRFRLNLNKIWLKKYKECWNNWSSLNRKKIMTSLWYFSNRHWKRISQIICKSTSKAEESMVQRNSDRSTLMTTLQHWIKANNTSRNGNKISNNSWQYWANLQKRNSASLPNSTAKVIALLRNHSYHKQHYHCKKQSTQYIY